MPSPVDGWRSKWLVLVWNALNMSVDVHTIYTDSSTMKSDAFQSIFSLGFVLQLLTFVFCTFYVSIWLVYADVCCLVSVWFKYNSYILFINIRGFLEIDKVYTSTFMSLHLYVCTFKENKAFRVPTLSLKLNCYLAVIRISDMSWYELPSRML